MAVNLYNRERHTLKFTIRNKRILIAILSGETLQSVGDEYHLSGPRIRQIVKKMCRQLLHDTTIDYSVKNLRNISGLILEKAHKIDTKDYWPGYAHIWIQQRRQARVRRFGCKFREICRQFDYLEIEVPCVFRGAKKTPTFRLGDVGATHSEKTDKQYIRVMGKATPLYTLGKSNSEEYYAYDLSFWVNVPIKDLNSPDLMSRFKKSFTDGMTNSVLRGYEIDYDVKQHYQPR